LGNQPVAVSVFWQYNDNMGNEIYLDNAATTRMHDEVMQTIIDVERYTFHNSAAQYRGSVDVSEAINDARQVVLSRLTKGKRGDLIFTSGATEGNNIVIFGKITNPRNHLIVLAGEHSSSYAPSVHLRNNNFDVDYIPLKRDGSADLEALKNLVKPNTALVVFSSVNSDTGVIQPIYEIVDIVRAKNPKAHIHCDAVQSFCKYDMDVEKLGLDSCVISAHKIYGPKGIGALWVKKGTSLKPIMYGGAQQDYRPGTENNSGIIGLAKAVGLFDIKATFDHVSGLYKILIEKLPSNCVLTVEPSREMVNPYIINIMLPNIYGQTVMNALSSRGIYVGLGSACNKTASKNRTLIAMGIPDEKTKNVLRISFGTHNTPKDVDVFCFELGKILDELG